MSIAMANQSSKDTCRRVARKCQANAEAGGAHGRRCYGYATGGLSVDEAEAAFYLTAVETCSTGMTLRAATRKLNAAGSLTTVGKPWSATGLRRPYSTHVIPASGSTRVPSTRRSGPR